MDPEEKELLEKTYELAEENNKILRGMRSSHRWNSFFRVIYWILIIAAAAGAYYWLEPYLSAATKAYSNVQSELNTVTSKLPGAAK